MVVGEPIEVPKDLEFQKGELRGDVHAVPQEMIDEYHAKYVSKLKELHKKYAKEFYGEDRPLEVK